MSEERPRAPGESKQLRELIQRLPEVSFRTLFDVGANVGTVVADFVAAFPAAEVYAFEPVGSSFEALQRSVAGQDKVHCFRLALSDRPGSAVMSAAAESTTNRILENDKSPRNTPTETVEVSTGDAFCRTHRIERIDYLKIDTEGVDLKVCHGFAKMLDRQAIDLVQVEAGMHRRNTRHVPLEAFKSWLEDRGYFIFKLYNQAFESRAPQLRRSNVVFISDDCLRRHTDAGWRK